MYENDDMSSLKNEEINTKDINNNTRREGGIPLSPKDNKDRQVK